MLSVKLQPESTVLCIRSFTFIQPCFKDVEFKAKLLLNVSQRSITENAQQKPKGGKESEDVPGNVITSVSKRTPSLVKAERTNPVNDSKLNKFKWKEIIFNRFLTAAILVSLSLRNTLKETKGKEHKTCDLRPRWVTSQLLDDMD